MLKIIHKDAARSRLIMPRLSPVSPNWFKWYHQMATILKIQFIVHGPSLKLWYSENEFSFCNSSVIESFERSGRHDDYSELPSSLDSIDLHTMLLVCSLFQ